MNKSDVAQSIAARLHIEKMQAEHILETAIDIIMDAMARGENVTLAGFGEFSARVRKGRIGVNPQDPSKPIDIPAVPVPKFKSGSRLKKKVKEGALAGGAPGATTPTIRPAAQSETPAPEPQPPTPPSTPPAPKPQPPTPPPAPATPPRMY